MTSFAATPQLSSRGVFLAAARDPFIYFLISFISLRRVTQSLRGVRGLDMGSIMVLQDGTDEKVCTRVCGCGGGRCVECISFVGPPSELIEHYFIRLSGYFGLFFDRKRILSSFYNCNCSERCFPTILASESTMLSLLLSLLLLECLGGMVVVILQ